MNRRHVERILAAANSQEAGRLFKRLRPESGNGGQLHARAEAAVLVSILDDFLRSPLIDAGDIAQQSPGGGVQIDADPVDAGFDSASRPCHQLFLIDIVLILADTDGLRIDFDQFRKRILQTARNGDSAAHGEVEIWKLLRARYPKLSRQKLPIR